MPRLPSRWGGHDAWAIGGYEGTENGLVDEDLETQDPAPEARLKASLAGDWRRIRPRTNSSASTRQITRTAGAAITRPSSIGTSLNANR